MNVNGPDQRTIERLEAARKRLDSGDLDDPIPGLYPAIIDVLELAQRRLRRDRDDPVIDYALIVADAVMGEAS